MRAHLTFIGAALAAALFCAGSASAASYAGWVDQATCTTISGWVWDSTQPNVSLNVDLYDNGAFLMTIPANQFRQDLYNLGYGNGNHGFSIATPYQLTDGKNTK
ncbi:MAG TPA: hypothetical protein VHD76_01365 [Bryobacteraceae bacterium]|jgi:hypothetical protein|nr:hypothetical protein [Bryobacteraceae bacterium]HVX90924.1 hypothetical protein [Candidatus Paceibacterota bacterium]